MELINAQIEHKIYTIRGMQVMLDSDLATLYQVETKVLNQAVKRNIERFPEKFRFQLDNNELANLRSQFVTLNLKRGKNIKYLPFVFTEQGVAMLSAVLRSNSAIQISIQIIDAFVAMRKTMLGLTPVLQRLDTLEIKQLNTDAALEKVFKALETDYTPQQGVFFEGQLFDAYVFVSNLIKKAKLSVALIDNYVNENTLLLLSKRNKQVSCTIYAKPKSTLLNDLEKHNQQYSPITLVENHSCHDRFLILDDARLYHIGASLKDLGKACFAFSNLDELLPHIKKGLLK